MSAQTEESLPLWMLFVKQLVNRGLVPTIVTVMGFGYVMTFTKCSGHLVNLLVKPLARVPVIVIPGAVIITWLLNIVLPSAAALLPQSVSFLFRH